MFPRGVDFIDLPLHADDRGQLTVAENSSLPFQARRVFWLTGVPEAAERGGMPIARVPKYFMRSRAR